ncbi:MAG: rod shape-determining protein MreD [Legionellales bacterium]|nr:rod shape-determining protein MreD [Legionellales bacterium]
MTKSGLNLLLIISASIITAFILIALPLPEWFEPLRPAWVALVVIYWTMALPHRFSIGWAWITGILLDILQGTLLGSHALALAVVAYIVAKWYVRLRLFSLLQQSLFVLLFLLLYQLLLYWPQAALKHESVPWLFWCSPLLGMALWPWVYHTLRGARRRFRLV